MCCTYSPMLFLGYFLSFPRFAARTKHILSSQHHGGSDWDLPPVSHFPLYWCENCFTFFWWWIWNSVSYIQDPEWLFGRAGCHLPSSVSSQLSPARCLIFHLAGVRGMSLDSSSFICYTFKSYIMR